MEVALLNVKVTIQKNTVTIDDIGNHRNQWTDYYTCYATVSGEGGTETVAVGTTVENSEIAFTVRYCGAAMAVNSTEYRIVFCGEIYNVLTVDHMNFTRRAVKFRCQKARR